MKLLHNILEKYKIEPTRYTIKNKVTLIDSKDGSFALKRKINYNLNIKGIYDYLKSRNFNYFVDLIEEDDQYQLFRRIDGIDIPKEEKVYDYFLIISLLHNKTTYYKEINQDETKEIYEKINNDINYIYNYYEDVIDVIEKKIYMSPSEYLLARNISKVFGAVEYCKYYLEKWYKIKKEKNKKRIVTVYNNPDLDHLIKNEDTYLISWEKAYRDSPIYDFLGFYKKYALEFDFIEILNYYESKYPLLEEERILLFILMTLPKKIIFGKTEYENCCYIRRYLDYLYKTEKIVVSENDSPK